LTAYQRQKAKHPYSTISDRIRLKGDR